MGGAIRVSLRRASPGCAAQPSAYVNDLNQGDEYRTAAVYGPNYQRLVELKRRYDPDNVFCHNANIRP